jgi:5-methylthioribose kinase
MANEIPDLLTVAGVLRYLAPTPFASNEIYPLSGGNCNFVYRIHLRTPYNNLSTLVLKHAEPYVAASAHRMPLVVERQVLISFVGLLYHMC